jgi:hypothetical protein
VRTQRSAWAFALRARTGVTKTSASWEPNIVEATRELGVPISKEEAHLSATLAQHQ